MIRYALLIAAWLLVAPMPVHAHGGGFGLNIFGLPPELNSLIWGSIFTAIAILSLFVLSRLAEERVRQSVKAKERASGSRPTELMR